MTPRHHKMPDRPGKAGRRATEQLGRLPAAPSKRLVPRRGPGALRALSCAGRPGGRPWHGGVLPKPDDAEALPTLSSVGALVRRSGPACLQGQGEVHQIARVVQQPAGQPFEAAQPVEHGVAVAVQQFTGTVR